MKRADLLDLDLDLPTSAEDIAALRRVARIVPGNQIDAVQKLHDALPPASRRPRRTTDAGRSDLEL